MLLVMLKAEGVSLSANNLLSSCRTVVSKLGWIHMVKTVQRQLHRCAIRYGSEPLACACSVMRVAFFVDC